MMAIRKSVHFLSTLCFLWIIGCGGVAVTWHGVHILPLDNSGRQIVTPDDGGKTPKIVVDQLRVLILQDGRDSGLKQLTAEQQSIMFGREFRNFCRQHCAKDSSGAPQFRLAHFEDQITGDWQTLVSKYGPPDDSSYPWIILASGNSGWSGRLTTWQALKPQIDKFAGITGAK